MDRRGQRVGAGSRVVVVPITVHPPEPNTCGRSPRPRLPRGRAAARRHRRRPRSTTARRARGSRGRRGHGHRRCPRRCLLAVEFRLAGRTRGARLALLCVLRCEWPAAAAWRPRREHGGGRVVSPAQPSRDKPLPRIPPRGPAPPVVSVRCDWKWLLHPGRGQLIKEHFGRRLNRTGERARTRRASHCRFPENGGVGGQHAETIRQVGRGHSQTDRRCGWEGEGGRGRLEGAYWKGQIGTFSR